MTSSIQYKFRTQNVNKTLSFDGPSITAIELKRAICNAENIKTELFDLVFVDSFSKKPYSGDDPILRNSSVTVVRVPVENGAKLPKISNPEISGVAQSDNISENATHISSEEYEKMTETERLKHAMHQSTYKYSTNNYKKKVNPSSQTVQAPPDYLCHRCNQLGHFPKACPLLNVRRTTGIPNEELMETTPDDPQAMLHPSGRFVIPIMHYKAREARRLQEEQRKLGILPTDSKSKQEKKEDPPHLKCPLCNNLFNDAVTAVCCGQNFCSDCIQQKMIDAGIADVPFQCPMCNKHIGDKELQENMTLREDVSKYKKSLLNPLTIQTPIDVSSELSIKPKVRKVQNLIIRPIIPFQPEIAEVTETSDTTNTIPVEPVKLPTVNLSAMFAPKPQPAPPIVHVVNSLPIPEIPDLTKPPPLVVDSLTLAHPIIDQTNFKFNETAIPSVPPKTNVSTKKNIIRNIELDDRDQAVIDKVWEKLAVADDDIDLATLFDDPKPSPKTERRSRSRSPVRSRSRDKSKRRSPKWDRRDGDRKDDRRYDVDKDRRKDKLKKDDIRDSGRSKERTSEASNRRHWDEKTRKDLQIKDETVKTVEKEPKIERELNQKSKTIETNNEEKTDLKELEKIDKNDSKKDLKIESKEERRESKEKRREIKKDERRREKELRKESRDDRRFEKELDRKDKREKLEKKIEDNGRENEEKSRKRDSRGERKEVELEKSKNNVKKEDDNKPRIDEKNERTHLENDETERREKRRREKDERNQEKEDRRESKKKAESEKNEVRQESRADDSRKEVNQDFDKNKRFQSLKDEEPAIKKLRTDSSVGKTNGSYVIDSVESTLKYPEKTNNERDEKAADVSKRSHRSSSHKKKHKKSKSEDREKKKKKKRKHDFDGEDDERSKKKRRRHDSNDDKSEQKSRRHHKDKKKKRDRKSRRRSNSDDDRRVEVS